MLLTNEQPPREEQRSRSGHNPTVALVLSIVFAGLGQLYNRSFIKGIVFIVVEAAFLITFLDFINLGLWGIATLGTIPKVDHSIFLLVYGIISILLLAIALTLYVINVKDARKQAIKIRDGWKRPSLSESIKEGYQRTFPYLITVPGFLMLIFIVVFPLLFAISLAFTNYNLYHSPPKNLVDWVGFENFVQLATVPIWNNSFVSVFSWTVVWTIVSTTLQIGLGLLLALIVNDKRIRAKKLIRTILILPWAVPNFVSILIFAALFNDQFGAINRSIAGFFGSAGLPWMTDPVYTKLALLAIQAWLGFPFLFALFTGVLTSISKEWYEAAEVDGATRWQKFRNITLPHVLFATGPLLIIQYTSNFNNFNVIYLFNGGGPAVRGQTAGGTDILISWVYKLTFTNNNYSMAAAISLIIGLIVIVFAFLQFRRSSSFREERNT
ncbi:carbohydrate ABC transporter permease [Cohnella cholangitidis]|uniref:Maltose/maltodextrin transport system permease protein n=1 Tax=Cohnella cholangitidis TaxID=2598458 RepID=A0A7G5BYA1_9BACL|nr:sugar ABC transporter permease [Cohnella cholangitidis]QMV41935.1 sugar ABC transporter permease [Cohnella cholangitidis]